jgi:orotate phosphoribosyltransferase
MTVSKSANKVAQALLEINAVGFSVSKPIKYKSGIWSPVYVDNRKLPFYPKRWTVIFEAFETLIEDQVVSFDILSGVETAGIPHSAALGFVLKRPSVFVRKAAKDHGTKKMVEGGDVEGKRVLLIEDHVTTGMSSLAAVQSLRDAGAIVTDCLSITCSEFPEVEKAFRDAKVFLHTLTSFQNIFEQAIEVKKILPSEVKVVKEWIQDPHNWGRKHGYE